MPSPSGGGIFFLLKPNYLFPLYLSESYSFSIFPTLEKFNNFAPQINNDGKKRS